MYLKQKYQRYRKKSTNFFEHDDRVNNKKINQNSLFKKIPKKNNNKNKRKIQKEKIVNCKQNLVMCYCHCSMTQLHAANTAFCCTATQQQSNCGGISGGGLPVNWKFFQSRCQCGICEINFFKNFKRALSPPKIFELYEKENQTDKFAGRGRSGMFSTSPSSDSYKKKLSKNNRKDCNSPLLHRGVDVTKILKTEDLKEILKGISDEKLPDVMLNKKNKKKKKKRHKKSKNKNSKSERSENDSSRRRKSRKYKKHKKTNSNADEGYSLKRSSSSKKNIENSTKLEEENQNIEVVTKKKSETNLEEIYYNSPDEETYDEKMNVVKNNDLKTEVKMKSESNQQMKNFSKSPSTESSSTYSINNKNSKSKSSTMTSNSLSSNKRKHSNIQEETQCQLKVLNNDIEAESYKSYKSNKKINHLASAKHLDISNSRNSKSYETKRLTDVEKNLHGKSRATLTPEIEKSEKRYNMVNIQKDSVSKNSKSSTNSKAASSSEISKDNNKRNENDRQFDNYNDNAISGKDLDSYVNAVMIDEYKEKKLNDFKLLEELKNNIAIKAKEKIKSIEKVSNDTFSAIPSVNKFISGILSSPESTNSNYPNIPTVQFKNLINETEDILQKKCKFADDNLKISKDISEENKISINQVQHDGNDENQANISPIKVKKSSHSRSNSRYSTGSSGSTPRSKYSYSSSRYSRSYSRSSSRSSKSSSHTRSRSRSHSRSPSIPRRRGSPSFLERRRITSARKRPIPYNRLSRSSSEQNRQIVCNTYTTVNRKYQPSI